MLTLILILLFIAVLFMAASMATQGDLSIMFLIFECVTVVAGIICLIRFAVTCFKAMKSEEDTK